MAAAARLAVARTFFDGFARGGEHFARPLARSRRPARGADDGGVEFFYEFFKFSAARGADVL